MLHRTNSQYALPTKQINPIGPHDRRIGHARRGTHPYDWIIRPEHEVAPVTEIVTTISESIRTNSRNHPKKIDPIGPYIARNSPTTSSLSRHWARICSIAPPTGANFKHRAAAGREFQASRRRRARICSIAPPTGANFKHRAANGRKFQASRRRRARISSIAPPSGAY